MTICLETIRKEIKEQCRSNKELLDQASGYCDKISKLGILDRSCSLYINDSDVILGTIEKYMESLCVEYSKKFSGITNETISFDLLCMDNLFNNDVRHQTIDEIIDNLPLEKWKTEFLSRCEKLEDVGLYKSAKELLNFFRLWERERATGNIDPIKKSGGYEYETSLYKDTWGSGYAYNCKDNYRNIIEHLGVFAKDTGIESLHTRFLSILDLISKERNTFDSRTVLYQDGIAKSVVFNGKMKHVLTNEESDALIAFIKTHHKDYLS